MIITINKTAVLNTPNQNYLEVFRVICFNLVLNNIAFQLIINKGITSLNYQVHF
ncbi:MAG: hypothetical protein ACI9L6_001430 [Flavobacterium sp.]|jgi:hypothetical protein